MRNLFIYLELDKAYVERLRNEFPDVNINVSYEKNELPQNLKEAEAVITFHFTKEMLDMAPKLKWLQVISAGVDSLPLEEIYHRNIILTNGRGVHKIHMGEYAMGAMISMARNFPTMYQRQKQNIWDRKVPQGEIYGSTVGILGLGSIGGQIAKLAKAFGMKVLGVQKNPKITENVDEVYAMEEIKEVFIKSDYVINLLPATKETHKLINKEHFNLMKETAVFINIGRGTTVNEDDLIDTLKNKRIRGFFSDVFYQEPLPEDSELWKLDNVVITPHICGASPKYNDRAMEIAKHNLKVILTGQGEMVNLVTKEKGY